MSIQTAVGRNSPNQPADVRTVQVLLGQNGNYLIPLQPVQPTGVCDAQTIASIETFQRRAMSMPVPTGIVAPDSPTWYALNGQSGPSSSMNPVLEEALRALESEAVNFAQRFIQDSRVRANYVAQATRASEEILAQVQQGALTAQQGAERAAATRNALLDAARLQNSDIGRAVAEAEKAAGLSLEALLERYAQRLYSRNFAALTAAEQDEVFLQVMRAAGRPNPRFTSLARNLGRAGKGLFIVSLAFATYAVLESDRPGREAARQAAGVGAGFLGSVAGGAAAGLACGPGAPVCVAVGAFAGGLVFAISADLTFEWLWE